MANQLLLYSADMGRELMTNMKLQKMLYYQQGFIWPILARLFLRRISKLGCMDRLFHRFMRNTKTLVN